MVKRRGLTASFMNEGDERKRTPAEASKRFQWHQNRSFATAPGGAWRQPTYWPCGVRCLGGVTLIWAFARNLRTCAVMPREKAQGRKPKAESTDALSRGGLLRSSNEAR